MNTIRQRWLDQLIKWCKAGQKAHAWHKAQELDKEELLAGIATELEKAMKSYNSEQLKNGG